MAAATPAQLEYIQRLLRKWPKGEPAPEIPADLDIERASAMIDSLKARTAQPEQTAPKSPATRAAGSTTLTATDLRAIAEGSAAAPEAMTADEQWVLYRLARLAAVERSLEAPVAWNGANGEGPILVEHLVAYFGSVEAVATAFKVSVGTVRNGWSGFVPANRAHEAAWLTRGYVQPPR